MRSMGAIIAGAVALSCSGAPPTTPTPASLATMALDASAVAANAAGMTTQTIDGTIARTGAAPPGRGVTTPGGLCHFWDVPVFTHFDGDVQGPVTFHEQQHLRCDRSHLVASGPFDGEVIWEGRTGIIAGQFTTNCKADSSQPLGLSCDGTMNARGSGGLNGVQFHFKWGPGWFPFSYTGTAFSK